MWNRKNLIALISIIVIATIIVMVMLWLQPANDPHVTQSDVVSDMLPMTLPPIIATKCQFCDNEATLVRKPDAVKVQQVTAWQGREPSEAEMQIVYCCADCKPIAGGFRTTTWYSL